MLAPTAPTINETAPQGHKRLQRRVLLADPSQEYFVHAPSSCRDGAPIVVAIHGQSRNADQQARLLAAHSEARGAILVAPLFSAEQHPDYQRLGRIGRGKRADIALNLIVAEVAAITGASAERFCIFGFSGGAQFAHRYTMANPHRVAGAVIASAGWYTFPDQAKRYPYGLRMNRRHPGIRFDAEEFLQIPMTVIVGKDDDSQVGLRRTSRIDREQGTTRVERARRWVAAMQAAAAAHKLESKVSYEEVENCDHSLRRSILRGGLGDKAFQALLGAPPSSTH
jgi:poly(3-hydroxybutyrate) depolymerase